MASVGSLNGAATGANSVSSNGMSSAASAAGGALDKNAFLQLLVAQMQYQDPLQPQDSTAFVAQLAQFTTLEQVMNLVQAVQQEVQTETGAYAASLIGKTIEASDANGNPVTGVVQAVRWIDGSPALDVGGQLINISNVTGIETSQSQE